MTDIFDRELFITADDFGLAPEINQGIVLCAEEELIHGVSVLVNCPASEEAFNLIPKCGGVEFGLHLGIVEGQSLTNNKSLLGLVEYFGKRSLRPNWKKFVLDFAFKRISKSELKEEFVAQIESFQKNVGKISFLNSTQHLHALPGVYEIVLELVHKYQIPRLRMPEISFEELNFTQSKILGAAFLRLCTHLDEIPSLGKTYGISVSGQMEQDFIDFVINESKAKKIELIVHPGCNSDFLKRVLPENYSRFDWEKEIESLKYLKKRINEP